MLFRVALDNCRDLLKGWRFKKRMNRDIDMEDLANSRNDSGDEQRMSTEIK